MKRARHAIYFTAAYLAGNTVIGTMMLFSYIFARNEYQELRANWNSSAEPHYIRTIAREFAHERIYG